MPEVKVRHASITSEDAKKMPPRSICDEGVYDALIINAPQGTTKGPPPLDKVTCEFQVMFRSEDKDAAMAGKRVYQDYLLEPIPNDANLSQRRRAELVQLLEAAKVAYTDEGFNTDHLLEKVVKITVRHRDGKQVDEETGKLQKFSNVTKVDTAEIVNDADLV